MAEEQGKVSGKEKFTISLSNFLQKNRVFLIIFLVVLIVAVIGTAIGREIVTSRASKAAGYAEKAQQLYSDWLTEIDDGKKEEIRAELVSEIDSIVKRYPEIYAGQRAYFIKGSLFYEEEEWQLAAENFELSAESQSDSYLYPIALNNASVAWEKAGEIDSAVLALERIVDEYEGDYPDMPKAMLSIGRLYEETEDFDKASEIYNRMVDDFPGDNWTKLARNRIIHLTVEGLISGEE